MTEDLIEFETAILAKEKGCDILNLPNITQSLLQKWLREEHTIIVIIKLIRNMQFRPSIYIYQEENGYRKDFENFFETYENALEAGLQEALKFIDNE